MTVTRLYWLKDCIISCGENAEPWLMDLLAKAERLGWTNDEIDEEFERMEHER